MSVLIDVVVRATGREVTLGQQRETPGERNPIV